MPEENTLDQRPASSAATDDAPAPYKVTVEAPVAITPPEPAAAPAAPPLRQARGAVTEGKTAILVCHGMGQQLQFSTLNSVVDALFNAQGRGRSKVDVRMIRAGESLLPRARIVLHEGEANEREVHLYEAYWAPLAEGKASITDVVKFLLDAGRDGLGAAVKPFKRWMFGDWQVLPRARALVNLLMAVLIVCSVALYGYAFVVAAGAKVLSIFGLIDPNLPLVVLLTSHVFAFLFAMMGVVIVLLALMLLHKVVSLLAGGGQRRALLPTLRLVNYAAAGLLLVAAAPLGASLVYHLVGLLIYHPSWLSRSAFVFTNYLHELLSRLPSDGRVYYLLLWVVAALAVYLGRWFLVQYVGDVAIYVTAHKVNKFYEVRHQIKEAGLKVANAVYEAQNLDTGNSEYEEVIVVGHSLGSVVAYDTLNAMINRDMSHGNPLRVVERTKSLITFGSPLDKTAFLFRAQAGVEDVRESLAAAVQPLICDYRVRPSRWINIFSRLDWISGALEYYDHPEVRSNAAHPDNGKAVENVEDLESYLPLVAHTQYWQHAIFAQRLYQEVMRMP
jgi:hypothetical protein